MKANLVQTVRQSVSSHVRGVALCVAIALAATAVAKVFGGPQLLYALLLGLALHFSVAKPGVAAGVGLCGRTLLRLGVALLGARITLAQVAELGVQTGLLLLAAVALTIALGVLLARWLGCTREQGLLSGGAVGICGASAALAISSVLPQTKDNERFTLAVVVGVTVLSTLAMVIYPFALRFAGADAVASGIVLGGTIHDVAQVVAAGMLLGPQAGDTATFVKLFRVMLLMPVVVVIAVVYRNHADVKTPDVETPLVPGFLLAFMALVLLASTGLIPPAVTDAATQASRWLLVVAIAAAGVKTSFADLLDLGWKPVLLMLGETIFIAAFVSVGVLVLLNR